MKKYFIEFLLITLVPCTLSLCTIFIYHEYFVFIAETYSDSSIIEDKINKMESGELVLSQEDILKQYKIFVQSDSKIATGFRMMANGTLYVVFATVVILFYQFFVLRRAYKIIKKSACTEST